MDDVSVRPRLLVLTSTYPRWRGDPEPAFVHELTRRLTDHFEVMVIAPHARGAATEENLDAVRVRRYRYAPECCETLVNDGGILSNLRRFPWKWLLVPPFLGAQWWATRKAVRHFQPQVIHAHWLLPQAAIAVRFATHVRVLATSHGADLFGLRGPLASWLRRRVLDRISSLGVVSEAMRRWVLFEAPHAPVQVLPMGVDCDHVFRSPAGDRATDTLLFVGRLVKKKGLIHLIESLPMVLETHPDTKLEVVGFGPEREVLQQRVEELGLTRQVLFHGALPQEKLPAHYGRATLFVAPFVEDGHGDQEGLGLVVAEAMACGCPVLVGDVAGVRDLVDGGAGEITDVRDHRILAATIVALLRDQGRRAGMAAAGQAKVRQLYSWPVVAERYARWLLAWAQGG